ncbi:MAG: hypothetical protein ACE5R4_00865 [Armatimonadota bacterium]
MGIHRSLKGAFWTWVALACCPAAGQVAPAGAVRISVVDCSAEQFVAEGMPQARADASEFRKAFAVLEHMGLEAADLSNDAQAGQLELADTDLLIIHRLTALTRASLAENAQALGEFVARGGTVVQVTPADQEQQVVDWLPQPLGAMITDLDFSQVNIEDPVHPLFSTPNPLSEADVAKITQRRGAPPAAGGAAAATSPVSWESFQGFREAKLLLTNRRQGRAPAVPAAGMLEFEHGDGRILLMSLRPFGAYLAPGTAETRHVVVALMENLLEYGRMVRAGRAPAVEPRVTFPW